MASQLLPVRTNHPWAPTSTRRTLIRLSPRLSACSMARATARSTSVMRRALDASCLLLASASRRSVAAASAL